MGQQGCGHQEIAQHKAASGGEMGPWSAQLTGELPGDDQIRPRAVSTSCNLCASQRGCLCASNGGAWGAQLQCRRHRIINTLTRRVGQRSSVSSFYLVSCSPVGAKKMQAVG